MRRTTVLLVEDDDDLRSSIGSTLRDAGYDIHEAAGGREAVAMLGLSTPDLVLLDMMMPHGNGWDVLDHLREAFGRPSVPVVVISAFASSLPRGASALLRKPVHRGDLLEAVAAHTRDAFES